MASRRQAILDAAAACIVRDGLAGFSTTSLCKEAGISTGALYRHFNSREDVLIGLTEREVKRARQFDSSSLAALRRSLIAMLNRLASEEGRFVARLDMELASAAAVNPSISDIVRPFMISRDLEAALADLRRRGEIKAEVEPASLAQVLATMVAGHIYLLAVSGHTETASERIVDTVLAPVLSPKPTGLDGVFQGVRDEHLVRPDGRIVAWTRAGKAADEPGAGIPVLRLPGTPGSRWSLSPDHDRWADLGLEVITTERPGYGRSSPLRNWSLADHADDLAAVLDHLGLDKVRVLGSSGGGPHVLAFASRHPDRVSAATIVVGLPWLTEDEAGEMIEFNRSSHRLARAGDRAGLASMLDPQYEAMAADPLGGLRTMMSSAPPADQAIMADPAWQRSFETGLREALRQGRDGWLEEHLVFARDWEIDLSAVRTSLTWWHGRADRNCPWPAAARMVDQMPNATLRELEGGHLAPVTHEAAILKELLARQ